MKIIAENKLIPSFGRRRGRKLRANRSVFLDTLLPQLLIALPQAGALEPSALFANKSAPLWFEIGFGGGEHLLEQARRNPQVNFIGCETYINGMASLLSAISKDNLTNIRLFDGDARELLMTLPDGAVKRMFVLFPDPWPKARHHKRRIISQATLALFYSKIKPGGHLRIATDHVEYGEWMLEQLQTFAKFIWTEAARKDWKNEPEEWVKTRYQLKAAAQGREPIFLELERPSS